VSGTSALVLLLMLVMYGDKKEAGVLCLPAACAVVAFA
jgi:hypothetical protein